MTPSLTAASNCTGTLELTAELVPVVLVPPTEICVPAVTSTEYQAMVSDASFDKSKTGLEGALKVASGVASFPLLSNFLQW